MIAPPNLCGNPQLIEVKQEQRKREEEDPDYDEDTVPPPSYPLRRFRFVPTWFTSSNDEQQKEQTEGDGRTNPMTLEIYLKSYVQLPPSDAVALFSGEDYTGLMTWMGSARLCQHLYDNFLPILRPSSVMTATNMTTVVSHKDNITNSKDENINTEENLLQQRQKLLLMSSFVKESFDTKSLKEFENVDTVVEIGCGSGLLGLVAGYALKSKSIIFTDGNSDCTDLAEQNFNLNFDKVFKKDGTCGKGRPFMWKNLSDEEVSKILFSHRQTPAQEKEEQNPATSFSSSSSSSSSSVLEFKKESSIVIVGGDIVYDFDSVVPLVETIHSLAKGFCDVRDVMCGGGGNDDVVSHAHFFLCFYPRQWYVADNRILLENVKDKLLSRGWRLILEAGNADDNGTLLHFVL